MGLFHTYKGPKAYCFWRCFAAQDGEEEESK